MKSEGLRARRSHRTLTDVDNFKLINDRYGHAGGDEFLVGLGRNMAARLHVTDSLARVGGDEFAILLPETEEAAARHVLSEIHAALRHFSSGHSGRATVSIGTVIFNSALAPDAMIAMADEAMYSIKQNGKNNVEYKLAG